MIRVSKGFDRRRCGFTILEVIIAAVVLAILVVALAPATLKMAAAKKTEATRQELREIHRAIVGSPRHGHYGFLGDLGRLPDRPEALVEAGPFPPYTLDTVGRIGVGWNGPYLQRSKVDAATDAFGNAYKISRKKEGQAESPGPDGVFDTDDDLVFPPEGFRATGSVRIELIKGGDYLVRLYYADGGVQKYIETDTTPYLFENVHRGPHTVEVWNMAVDPPLLVGQTVIVLVDASGLFMIDL